MKKRIILAVTNDLEGDQRLHKTALFLHKEGWEPVLVGRRLPDSTNMERPWKVKRFRLLFLKGPFFYLEYNFRLFFFLLFTPAVAFTANDLDTLPAVFLVSRLRRKPMVYDSHELFTGVPELVDRPIVQSIWSLIERAIFPRLKLVITVNRSIADWYKKRYGVEVEVVRNVPLEHHEEQSGMDLPEAWSNHPVLIYQGAVNKGRGLEYMIDAMAFLDEMRLCIAGGGDLLNEMKNRVSRKKLDDRVWFAGRVPPGQLRSLTRQATLGLSLEQDIGLNYRYALPNKLFDYMHAGLPVLVSDLPEIRRVVESAGFGRIIGRFDPEYLSVCIREMVNDPVQMKSWSEAARIASRHYTWEQEEGVLKRVYGKI